LDCERIIARTDVPGTAGGRDVRADEAVCSGQKDSLRHCCLYTLEFELESWKNAKDDCVEKEIMRDDEALNQTSQG